MGRFPSVAATILNYADGKIVRKYVCHRRTYASARHQAGYEKSIDGKIVENADERGAEKHAWFQLVEENIFSCGRTSLLISGPGRPS